MSSRRTRIAIARFIGLLLCIAFMAGSIYVPPGWATEHRVLAGAAVSVMLALGLAVAWILVGAVVEDLREWRNVDE